ncbi:MAG: alpha/beta hydrolase-fold protein [Candidatus Bathyarchaeota archaeon]|jgi:enterochelin esterase family protein
METFQQFKKYVQSASDRKTREKRIRKFIRDRKLAKGFPIIENELVTFIYLGEVKNKISISGCFNDWHRETDFLQNIEGTNLYYKSMNFATDARIEYAFIKDEELIIDPFNKRQGFGGLGAYSELRMPEYTPPTTIKYSEEIPHGTTEAFRFKSKILCNNRIIHVYLPPGYSPEEEYPAIFAQDGSDYLRFGYFDNVLDNLIEKHKIMKVIGIFIDPDNRLLEYDLNNKYIAFLVNEVVPFVDDTYTTKSTPSSRLVMGASFGGLISCYAALLHPHIFGKVASQSGYLSRNDDWIINEFKANPRKSVNFYLDCGIYEKNVGGIYGDFTIGNRKMRDILKAKGYKFTYKEFSEGHNWGNWRSRISAILMTFFGDSRA